MVRQQDCVLVNMWLLTHINLVLEPRWDKSSFSAKFRVTKFVVLPLSSSRRVVCLLPVTLITFTTAVDSKMWAEVVRYKESAW